jgi:soluble lytic murein transglycosylase
MKKLFTVILCLWVACSWGTQADKYLNRFQAYLYWNEKIPLAAPSSEFIAFISSNKPLSQKIRNKWLYQLAGQKNWALFNQHYRPTSDVNLQCFHVLSAYWLGSIHTVRPEITTLWLTGHSQPPACNGLFNLLLQANIIEDSLIAQRIELALENKNAPLARYLLKQFKPSRTADAEILTNIYVKPETITQIKPGFLHGALYLYGLKRLALINMKKAIKLWNTTQARQLLSNSEKQSFISFVAMYKVMRNDKDAAHWFNQLSPPYKDQVLLEWRIRLALKELKWREVEHFIKYHPEKDQPGWKYWIARAKEAQGNKEESLLIYQKLASLRNYYGFLASMRIGKKFNFANESPVINPSVLQSYHPVTSQIRALFTSNHIADASRLINDFFLELSKQDKCIIAFWLINDLKWYAKALNLSNSEDLTNQLALRFPLIYQNFVNLNANTHHVSKEFIYAIIRQESTFREDIISPAGAHGLMQLMPATAKIIAKQEKIAFNNNQQLFTALINISIGTAYLKQLAKRFDHPVLISAAYNAGPRQVVYWIKNHPPKQMDIWIETLPWRETRNYIKNIIAFYAVYQYRMNKQADIGAFLRPIS